MVTVVLFIVIALLRVIQKISNKNSSMLIITKKDFFRYGTIYQFLAGLISCFALIWYGTSSFNLPTVICSLIMAILFALDLYTGVEALKEASLAVVNIYSLGGLILSCILSYFMFGEKVSIFQGIGLVVFFVGVYLLTPSGKKEKHKLSIKTIFMLILSFFANGLVMVTQKYFSLKVIDGNTAMFSFLTFMINSLLLFVCWMICIIKDKKDNINKENKHKRFLGLEGIMYLYAFLMAISIFGCNVIITELGKKVSSVVLFPISSAIAIMVTVIVGWLVYKEKLSKKAIIGLILGFLSIIIVGVFTPEFVAKFL